MKHPTSRQILVLTIIDYHLRAFGRAPTMREIRTAIGVSGLVGIQKHLDALVKKLLITRIPCRPRAIALTDAGEAVLASISSVAE